MYFVQTKCKDNERKTFYYKDKIYKSRGYELNKIKALIIFFLLFLCLPLFGEEKTFSAGEIKSITLKVVHLNVKVVKNHTADWTIKWMGDLYFHTEGGLLTIRSRNVSSKKSWRVSSSKPVLTLEISGPSVPIKIFSFFSQSSFSSWTKPVFISSFRGNIKGSKNKGSWNLSLKEGRIDIDRHQGSLSVKGFRVNHLLSSSKGRFQYHINEGQLKVEKTEGLLNFITNKAEVKLKQFEGDLKGSSQSGKITAVIQPENVDIFSGEGAVRFSFVGGYSPQITAYTERGRIYGPKYLYKKFSGKSTKLSGWFRGSKRKGKVFLESNTGNIYIN